MGRLSGKVALVTGAGSGFGEAIAHGFTSEGAKVLIADIAVANGERVCADIMAKKPSSSSSNPGGGGEAFFVELNVTRRADWERGLELAKQKFGKLDIVVNNAGTTYKKQPSMGVSEEDFDRIVAVNIKSIYLSVSVLMPYFVERKAGVFLNTSSVAATRVRPGQVFYGGTKGFVNTVIGPPLWFCFVCADVSSSPPRSLKDSLQNTAPRASESTRFVRFEARRDCWKCSAVFQTRRKRGNGLRRPCRFDACRNRMISPWPPSIWQVMRPRL